MGVSQRQASGAVAARKKIRAKPSSPNVAEQKMRPTDDAPAKFCSALQLPRLDDGRYQFRRVLVDGLRNGGRIELFDDLQQGCQVAGKRLPHAWTLGSPEAFTAAHPNLLESPWKEIDVNLLLGSRSNGRHALGTCHNYGVFLDGEGDILLISEYIPGGDLHDLASRCVCEPGPEREEKVWPVLISLLQTVSCLHTSGVAHGDISLENALLGADGEVRLIDFEAAVTEDLQQAVGSRGKPSYQAPEMHGTAAFDARATDLFACGVFAYCLAIGDYPWKSTRPGCCRAFDFFTTEGFQAFLRQRRVRCTDGSKGQPAGDVLSSELQQVLGLLLHLDPQRRSEAYTLALTASRSRTGELDPLQRDDPAACAATLHAALRVN